MVVTVKLQRKEFAEMTEEREERKGLILIGTETVVGSEDGGEDETGGNSLLLVLVD